MVTFTDTSKGGRLYESHANYATVWADTNAASFVQTEITVGQRPPGASYGIWRSALLFDTSTIPAGATITAAAVLLYGISDNSTDDFDITIQKGAGKPSDPVVTQDYNKANYSGDYGTLGTAGFNPAGWNTLTITDFSIITKAGTTRMILRSSEDIAGSSPTADEYVACEGPTHGGGHDPKLEVTYSLGSPSTTYRRFGALIP